MPRRSPIGRWRSRDNGLEKKYRKKNKQNEPCWIGRATLSEAAILRRKTWGGWRNATTNATSRRTTATPSRTDRMAVDGSCVRKWDTSTQWWTDGNGIMRKKNVPIAITALVSGHLNQINGQTRNCSARNQLATRTATWPLAVRYFDAGGARSGRHRRYSAPPHRRSVRVSTSTASLLMLLDLYFISIA